MKSTRSRGLAGSPFGVVGLETAFSALYTHLVKRNVISLDRLIELMVASPRRRFGIPRDDGFSVRDLDERFTVDPAEFLSLGRATPFAGEELFAVNRLTVFGGKPVYRKI